MVARNSGRVQYAGLGLIKSSRRAYRFTIMKRLMVMSIGCALLAYAPAASALDLGSMTQKLKGSAGNAARDKAVKDMNAKLLAEGRKNQCSFKTDSDQLTPGCDAKLKRLVDVLVKVKQNLKVSGVTNYKFEVSGHTDTSGSAEHNKELSGKRAAVLVRELVARGVDQNEIISVGMGAERPLVTPDNTEAKKAKNRRYEIQLRF
jgi:outer membrane protein OmpA-like peptidoglycan-associated protein